MKEIEGYPNYMVSECGGIWSRNRNKYLAGSLDRDGYVSVTLCNSIGQKNYRVHRLVAQAYLSNPNNLPVINHKNGIKDDNCVGNIEWCGVSYNTKHAYLIGSLDQSGEKNNSCKYKDDVVSWVKSNYKGGNISSFAREIGLPYGSVYAYIKNLRRS
jgi:hypothetical protein